MPLYEALCAKCKTVKDVYVSRRDGPLPECPDCQGHRTRAIISACYARFPAAQGVKLTNGEFVRGTWGPPPRRRKERIKVFP